MDTYLLFLSYILMNNFYQGSVYSYLTANTPPRVPRTIEQLSNSNIKILTTTPIGSRDPDKYGLAMSTLKHFSIPQLIRTLGQNNSYSRLLSDLDPRIVHIKSHRKYGALDQ